MIHVLGIESSCDETAAAVVRSDGLVLSDIIATQIKDHAPFGGVVPEIASRAHLRNLMVVLRGALDEAKMDFGDLDGIAVTNGPGLVGSLLVGVQAAKAIAYSHDLKLVGVNHLHGHLLAGFLHDVEEGPPALDYPYVALLVSGGHTALYRVESPFDFHLLGQTRDDAAGEAFDKVAKLLELGYPGGPIIDRLAESGDPKAVKLPRPMLGKSNLEFSFSGLKTAVAQRIHREGPPEGDAAVGNLCASFQHVVVESLVRKSIAACEQEGVSRLVITGGVAANRGLRTMAQARCQAAGIRLTVPPFRACTDNAAMIAYCGAQRLLRGDEDDRLTLAAYSRDPARKRGRFASDGTHLPRKT